jgi:hypothetical protein
MKQFLWGFVGLAVLVSTWLVVRPAPALAATEGFNVITSPLPIKISTPPGKTITEQLRIKNQGDQPEGIKVGLMKFAASGNTGQPDLYDFGPTDTYASWVHFSPEQFTAQPNVWDTITMTIDIPSTADLGYYLAVTFSPANQPDAPDSTDLKGSAATLVLLDVKTPNEKRSLQLLTFTTDHQLYEYLPVNFNINVHNNGNIYLAPVGNIFVQRGSKTISTIDFNDDGGSVLPGSNRLYIVPWTDGFPVFKERIVNGKPVPDKHDVPKKDLTWDFTQASKFRIGKYNAKLLVVYDNGTDDVPLEATVSFWVLPWKLLLVVLVVVVIIGFGVFTVIRSVVRKTRGGVGKVSNYRRHGKR